MVLNLQCARSNKNYLWGAMKTHRDQNFHCCKCHISVKHIFMGQTAAGPLYKCTRCANEAIYHHRESNRIQRINEDTNEPNELNER